jgi:hypothetical protein
VESYNLNDIRKHFFVSSFSEIKNVSVSEIMDDGNILFNKIELEIWKNGMLIQSEGLVSEVIDINAEV